MYRQGVPLNFNIHNSPRIPTQNPRMTQNEFCGIVHSSKEGTLIHLILEEVRVQAVIVDASAKVTLSQVFLNPLKEPTSRAKYVFPVPARAAVCAFEMRTESGHVIMGIAKEKKRAAAAHAQAIRQGRMTGLVEWATNDVFTLSLGAIPAEQKLTTKLTYTVDLMNDDLTDQMRFQIPMCVGMRYGWLPYGLLRAFSSPSTTRVRITIGIQMKGDIQSITSPSHPQIIAYPCENSDGGASRNRMLASYESPAFLSQDFIVHVQARGLDEPRCFAERDLKHGSVSLQLTIVPKLNLPPIKSQEYIFLVDRSGSMAGPRMVTAKRTLVMLLHSLPASGSSFNIFSFGSLSSRMFPSSSQYTQDSLSIATEHVDEMAADYGGTDIRSALEGVFNSRNRHLPTALFVLTDGEAYDIDSTVRSVSYAVSKSSEDSPLRIFVVGIGETTSTAMCEGIARAGNGICLMAATSENILGKCAKLVRASRNFVLRDVSINWGVPTEAQTRSTLKFRNPPPKRESIVLQAPRKIQSVYPGLRCVVTVMIKDREYRIPKEIVLRGRRDIQDDIVEIKVPVQLVQPTEHDDTIPLVNTLAARRIITELEDPKNGGYHTAEQQEATIIRIGEEYQLASRYTSFVAVGKHISEYQKGSSRGKEKSQEKEEKSKGHSKRNSLSRFVGNFFGSPSKGEPLAKGEDLSEDAPEGVEEDWDWGDEYFDDTLDSCTEERMERRILASGPPQPAPLAKRKSSPLAFGMGHGGSLFARTKLFGRGHDVAPTVPSTPPVASPPEPLSNAAASNEFDDPYLMRQEEYSTIPPGLFALMNNPTPNSPPVSVPYPSSGVPKTLAPHTRGGRPTDPPVVRLVRLQSFDGSFIIDDEFTEIIGKDAIEKGKVQGVDESIWAMALAVAFLRKHLADQPELLDCLVEKVMDFINGSPLGTQGTDFDALVAKAKDSVD